MAKPAAQSTTDSPDAPASAGTGKGRERGDAPGRADDRTDSILVEQFRSGQRRAFDQLVERHQRAIFHLTLRYLRNQADAADITQKTFVRAFQSFERFRGESSFRTWIFRIAINLCLNHIRDHRREQVTEIGEDVLTTPPLGAGRMIRENEARRLRDALDELPPKQRMVLELRVYDELSFREVAELADCSENAAKVNFHHAVKRLRAILTADDDASHAGGREP